MGVLKIRVLLFRVLYWGPLFSETTIFDVVEMSSQSRRKSPSPGGGAAAKLGAPVQSAGADLYCAYGGFP